MANPWGYELPYAKAPPKPKHEIDETEAIANMVAYAHEQVDLRARCISDPICDNKLRTMGRPWNQYDIIILQNELKATFDIKKLPDQVVQVLKERCS